MPVYEYTALDEKGRRQKGIVDAAGMAAARQKLREMSVFPTDMKETFSEGKAQTGAEATGGSLFKKAGLAEIAVMTRQLATLLKAGLPLVPSLTVLVAQTRHPQLKKTLVQIREEVNEGNSLTGSLSHFPGIFSPFYINMVRAGEASGTLDLILERLADFFENQQALRMKIRAALAYPLLMFLVGSVVLFFLVAFVVPNITRIFGEMHQNLPGITIFLIAVSGFLKTFWWVCLLLLFGLIFGLRYAVTKTDRGRYIFDGMKLKAPLFGPVSQKVAVARFSRTLGTLLQSGVPLLGALEIVRNIMNNRLIADELQSAGKAVEEGQGLAATLAENGLFPPMAIELISVGEQSGTIETMLFRIADAFEKEVEASILIMMSLLEPVMVLTMGLVVGFIVVSILLPIFEMNQLVR
ncbi:MAG: type II secretion system inner membrane protein GspF [Deltaproteobacteria bacterium]|nr:type II secretion system inner membrane protein GspF [Deltaproteobacteria bacterium]